MYQINGWVVIDLKKQLLISFASHS